MKTPLLNVPDRQYQKKKYMLKAPRMNGINWLQKVSWIKESILCNHINTVYNNSYRFLTDLLHKWSFKGLTE